MNEVLSLKGHFEQRNNPNRGGGSSLPKNTEVKIEKMEKLLDDLLELNNFWKSEKYVQGALVSVRYKDVIAKSRRISGYLSKGKITSNESIVGARFTSGKLQHIITHHVSNDLLEETIKRLYNTITLAKDIFKSSVSYEDIENLRYVDLEYDKYNLKKSHFINIVIDSYYVEEFYVYQETQQFSEDTVITIFDIKVDAVELFKKLNIRIQPGYIINNTTILLNSEQLDILLSKANYLVSMATVDLSTITKFDFINELESSVTDIPKPTNEPYIGVIDTMFDENVYFSDWVEFKNMLSDDIELDRRDFEHGTAVTSLIVDGPTINPMLNDGCGRFKVKHFGVAKHTRFSSFAIMKSIEQIVKSNRDIKVWNLSLGSVKEINDNFISIEGAILDRLQYEYDITFIVSGTNKPEGVIEDMKIGAPADSINSIIVNSVDMNNVPASYSRLGIVLSFFNKPDISYYGGTNEKLIRVCKPNGEAFVKGTSYSAPWIARKMAYLIEVLGLSREVAKALLIDSATGWNEQNTGRKAALLGHGIVPIHIKDIISTNEDEIKFLLSGRSEKYDTYTYNIPVPIYKGEFPFYAKATMCYYPKCSRNQGVDYTNTELDVHFGRIFKDNKGEKKIKSINNNVQSSDDFHYLREPSARKLYRKWDNSKHIREVITPRSKSRKTYDTNLWGLSIKTKERLNQRDGKGIGFGVVVTLKELNGVNRIEDFIQQCQLRGWYVNRLDVQSKITLYNKVNEDITFD